MRVRYDRGGVLGAHEDGSPHHNFLVRPRSTTRIQPHWRAMFKLACVKSSGGWASDSTNNENVKLTGVVVGIYTNNYPVLIARLR